jgi:hypothetical protein
MTIYLLDANVIIRAHEDYYPVDSIPQFWAWLIVMGNGGLIKIPKPIFDEITPSTGPLHDWIKRPEVKQALILDEPIDVARVNHVLVHGYAPDLNDVEIEQIGKDPFLIAAALGAGDRVVVTREVSKPRATRANKQVPDVCAALGVQTMTNFQLYKTLAFSTS